VLGPLDEPILYILELIWNGADSRGIRMQQRKIAYGMAPPGWGAWRAATEFPFEAPHRNPALRAQGMTEQASKTVAVEFEADNVEDAFKKAMPLLVAEMDKEMRAVEKRALAAAFKSGAAEGARLGFGRPPDG
jgi:hypothetical protein